VGVTFSCRIVRKGSRAPLAGVCASCEDKHVLIRGASRSSHSGPDPQTTRGRGVLIDIGASAHMGWAGQVTPSPHTGGPSRNRLPGDYG